MTNLEFYKEEIKEKYKNFMRTTSQPYGRYDLADALYEVCWKRTGKKNIIDWLCEEHKEPILDEEEKEYLSAVIRPFRNRIHFISKQEWISDRAYTFIRIRYGGWGLVNLPTFKKDTMYKGMELNKEYTLEELGL